MKKIVIDIDGEKFEKIGNLEKVTIPDSFVFPSNKLGTGKGHREIYFGSKSDEELQNFLGGNNFILNSFLLKNDLIEYLEDAKKEYFLPEQEYRDKDKMSELWEDRIKDVSVLDNKLFLNIIENKGRKEDDPRLYVIPDEESKKNYDLIRKLSLPKITYLSILKLKNKSNRTIYYFKLFLDYFIEKGDAYNLKEVEDKIKEEVGDEEEIKKITQARIGQGKYREKLLEQCPFCPITLVTDERVLIASHIKPWAKSDNMEKIDSKNGFMLSPNIDRLFDRGFITFTDDKIMKASPWLSNMTYKKLNIFPDKKYDKLPVEGREKYLEYHRKNIFKK